MFYALIIAAAGSAIFLIIFSIIQERQRPTLQNILTDLPYVSRTIRKEEPLQSKLLQPVLRWLQPMTRWRYFTRLQTQAEILKIKLDLTRLLLFKILAAIIVGAAAFFLLSRVYSPLACVAGFFLPDFVVWSKVKAKRREIERIFPETVDLLDMCINSGADFLTALKWVVEKSVANPFTEQLAMVLSEIRIGKTKAEALKDMAKRLNLSAVSTFSRTLIQAERMGTSIVETFNNLSEDTRAQRFQFGERYAIRASLKILFPLLFCILPAILIIVAGPIIIKFTSGELVPKGGPF
jgi:tight adherence protein C